MSASTVSGPWPDGTTVYCYRSTQLPAGSTTPTGLPVDTDVCDASGVVTFDGLTELVQYVALGAGRPVRFLPQGITDAGRVSDRNRINAIEQAIGPSGANIAVVTEAPINVQYPEFGARGDGSADDVTALQAAVDKAATAGEGGSVGAEVLLPPGAYKKSGVLTVGASNVTIRGAGPDSTIIYNDTGDVLELGDVGQLRMYDLTLQANALAGDVVTSPWNLVFSHFHGVRFRQANPDKHVWLHAGVSGHFIANKFDGCRFEHVATATVPAFHLTQHTLVGDPGINNNTWQGSECLYSGAQPFFLVESLVAGGYNIGNTWRDTVLQGCNGGHWLLMGGAGSVIENVSSFDTTAPVANDLIWLGKHPSGERCLHTTVRNVLRAGGSFASGKTDLRVNNAWWTTIEKVNTVTNSGCVIELANNPYVNLRDLGDGVTVQGAAGYTINESGWGMTEVTESASDPAAPAADAVRLFARDNGSGKTQWCARFATGAVQVIATQP